jgi:hypothetical protein
MTAAKVWARVLVGASVRVLAVLALVRGTLG